MNVTLSRPRKIDGHKLRVLHAVGVYRSVDLPVFEDSLHQAVWMRQNNLAFHAIPFDGKLASYDIPGSLQANISRPRKKTPRQRVVVGGVLYRYARQAELRMCNNGLHWTRKLHEVGLSRNSGYGMTITLVRPVGGVIEGPNKGCSDGRLCLAMIPPIDIQNVVLEQLRRTLELGFTYKHKQTKAYQMVYSALLMLINGEYPKKVCDEYAVSYIVAHCMQEFRYISCDGPLDVVPSVMECLIELEGFKVSLLELYQTLILAYMLTETDEVAFGVHELKLTLARRGITNGES